MVRRIYLPLLLPLLLMSTKALAQGGQHGSIVGYVFDQAGAPLKGVKVTAKSDTQIGGTKTTYTNDEGSFRFPILEPGLFEVQASAPKMQTQVQKDIKVGINAPAEVNLIMEVQTTVEEVKVVQKPPIVSTTSANLKEDFDLDFVAAMPLGSRDNAYGQMVNEVGGVVNGAVRGGAGNQTTFTQDGFDMKGSFPTMKSAASYEISTGGYGNENAMAAGGLVNLVTRSGSNKWELEFNGTYEASQLRFFTDGGDGTAPSYYYVLNPTVTGPIIKDRLWFAFNMETQINQQARDKDPNGYLPDPLPNGRLLNKGTFKVTWQISPRNKLQSLTNIDNPREFNLRGLGYGYDAQEDRIGIRTFTGLIWESLLSDNLVFRSQWGATYTPYEIFPKQCWSEPAVCDHSNVIQQNYPVTQVYGGALQHIRQTQTILQFRNRFEWFLNGGKSGEHNITLHDFFYTETNDNGISHPGDTLTQYNGPDPQSQTVYYSNDPRYENAPRYGWFWAQATVYRHMTTASDSWRLTRYLTLTPALSHIWATGNNSRGDHLFDTSAFAPSMALAWDATHDGRTVVRSSFNTYVDVGTVLTDLAYFTVGNTRTQNSSNQIVDQPSQNCQWDATANGGAGGFTKNCTFSGGLTRNTFGLPCGPQGINPDGTDCHQKLRVPRTWEYTFGAEREVIQGLAIEADLSYRKFLNPYERLETNRIWNNAGSALDANANFRNGRNETIQDLETPDTAQRRYVGVTLGVKKREGRLKIFTYYTLSSLVGNVPGSLDGTYGQNPARDGYLWGYLPNDHRHEVKTTTVYQATNWLMIGGRYEYISGMPYNHMFRNDVTGGFDDFRAYRGTNPGSNINDPATNREIRLPDTQSFNLQVRVNWLPLIGQRLDTYVDWLNVLALRTITGVNQNDGPAWGTPNGSRMGPMFIRLGLNYRY